MKKVEEQYKVEQLKKETAAKLSGYKKKVLAGKLPTPGQQAAFNTLDEEAKEKFLAKLDKAKQGAAQSEVGDSQKPSPHTPTSDQTAGKNVAQKWGATWGLKIRAIIGQKGCCHQSKVPLSSA